MVGAWKVSWQFTTDDDQIAFAISFRSRAAPASDDPEGLDPTAPVLPPAPEQAAPPAEAPVLPLPLAPPPPEPLPFVAPAPEPSPGDLVPVETLRTEAPETPAEAPVAAAPPPTPNELTPPPAPEIPFAGPVATIDTLHAKSDVPAAEPEVGAERRDGAPVAGAAPQAAEDATKSDATAAAAATPASAPPPHAPPPPRPGEVDSDTDIVSEAATDFAAKPVYSKRAIDLGLEGKVTLLAEVRADGRVESCEIETSSGHELLDEAARKALRKWRFKPRRTNGVAHPFKARVPFDFFLQPRQ